jgi:ketosteroid isomerase-like protein
MSRENVEIVRRSYDAYVRGNLGSALAAFDPDVVACDHDIPDSGEYSGLDGLFRWQADWESGWENWRWEPEEFIEAGEGVVAVAPRLCEGTPEWR